MAGTVEAAPATAGGRDRNHFPPCQQQQITLPITNEGTQERDFTKLGGVLVEFAKSRAKGVVGALLPQVWSITSITSSPSHTCARDSAPSGRQVMRVYPIL